MVVTVGRNGFEGRKEGGLLFGPDTGVEVKVVNDTDGEGEVLEVLAEAVGVHNRAEQLRLEEVASIGDGDEDLRADEGEIDGPVGLFSEGDDSFHEAGREDVSCLDLVVSVGDKASFEFGVFELYEGVSADVPLLEHFTEAAEESLGGVGEEDEAAGEVFVEVRDDEEAFEDGSTLPILA